MSSVQVAHMFGSIGHHAIMRQHTLRHTGTRADRQEMKRVHTHTHKLTNSQSITDTNTREHLNTPGRARLAGVSGSS